MQALQTNFKVMERDPATIRRDRDGHFTSSTVLNQYSELDIPKMSSQNADSRPHALFVGIWDRRGVITLQYLWTKSKYC